MGDNKSLAPAALVEVEDVEEDDIEILQIILNGKALLPSDLNARPVTPPPYPGARIHGNVVKKKWKKRGLENKTKIIAESEQGNPTIMESLATPDCEDYYFDSYARHGIHEMMLKDQVRTITYRDAILMNKHLFKDKIVLDVGCGTGILSMFAAQAGAARVIGIDNADIALYAKQIIRDNNFDSVVTIIHGKVEQVELPDGIEKVDVIISEWMGYCLLLESMLETVLFARDKWLKFNGAIFPDKCSLYIVAIADGDTRTRRINYLDDVCNFDLSCLKEHVLRDAVVCSVQPNHVASSHYEIIEIDINTIYKEELNFKLPFSLQVKRDCHINGFTTYFSVDFHRCHTKIGFSTAPEAARTHWKQTVFYLKNPIYAKKGDRLHGKLSLERYWKNFRTLIVEIDYEFEGKLSRVNGSNLYCVH